MKSEKRLVKMLERDGFRCRLANNHHLIARNPKTGQAVNIGFSFLKREGLDRTYRDAIRRAQRYAEVNSV